LQLPYCADMPYLQCAFYNWTVCSSRYRDVILDGMYVDINVIDACLFLMFKFLSPELIPHQAGCFLWLNW